MRPARSCRSALTSLRMESIAPGFRSGVTLARELALCSARSSTSMRCNRSRIWALSHAPLSTDSAMSWSATPGGPVDR